MNKEFDIWLNQTVKSKPEKNQYCLKHYIPDVDLNFKNFLEFFESREELLIHKFKEVLQDVSPRIRRRTK
jgi:hypothetical protein